MEDILIIKYKFFIYRWCTVLFFVWLSLLSVSVLFKTLPDTMEVSFYNIIKLNKYENSLNKEKLSKRLRPFVAEIVRVIDE